MTRQQISQTIAALVVVLGIVAAADPELVPVPVQRWALLLGSIVSAAAGALGFNVPRGSGTANVEDVPRYQRHDR